MVETQAEKIGIIMGVETQKGGLVTLRSGQLISTFSRTDGGLFLWGGFYWGDYLGKNTMSSKHAIVLEKRWLAGIL